MGGRKSNRRQFLRTAGYGALAMISYETTSVTLGSESARKPLNFVFILADDWGWGDLGCYGHEIIRTPNLDKLASEGLRFTQFYVNSPVCSPTRAAILTCRFPSQLRIFGHFADSALNQRRGMPNWLDPAVTTSPRVLKQAGYVTGHFGKWHLGDGEGAPEPSAYGFDEYRVFVGNGPRWNVPDFNARSSELIVNEALQFIETHKNEPFFVNVWLKDLHAVLEPTEEQMSAYPELKGAYRIYCSAATNADRQLGRLFKKLESLRLAENTVVIFTSDNGPEDICIPNAAHSGVGSPGPFRGRKRSLYEGGIRTPFIIRLPGVTPQGKVDNQTVLSGVDMLPTICSMAGVKLPEDCIPDGEDMSAAFGGKPVRRTKPLMWEFRYGIAGHVINRSPMLAIRENDWKLLINPDGSRQELYDITKDYTELNNVAGQHPKTVKELANKVIKWFDTLPSAPIEPEAGKADYCWPRDA